LFIVQTILLMSNCIHYKIEVEGKVQGVWFRKYTQEKACLLGLKGYVMNLPNGNVYVEVEGSESEKLQSLIDWLSEGSPLSKVEKVHIKSKSQCMGYQDFRIKK